MLQRRRSPDRGGRPFRVARDLPEPYLGEEDDRSAHRIPASQPGARPPAGAATSSRGTPLRARSQEITELEFHISPVSASSRPQTSGGTWAVEAKIAVA